MNIRLNVSTIYKQLVYILLITILLYILYQLVVFKKDPSLSKNSTTNILPESKIKVLLIAFIVATFGIVYFKIGVDELQVGGEQKLNDVFKFEKSMIDTIRQDVSVGKVPF
jgi:membrane-anchored glycerophosphoryl diester phosphodiesterase (GDPDase)